MKVLAVINLLFKRSLNNKISLLIYIFVPIVGLALPLLVHQNTNKDSKVNIAIVDYDKSNLSAAFSSVLSSAYKFNIKFTDSESAKRQLVDNKITAMIQIPKGFEEELINNRKPNIDLLYVKESESSTWLKQLVNSYLLNLNILSITAKGDINKFNKLYDEFFTTDNIIKTSVQGASINTIGYSTLGFMMLFMIMMVSNSFSLIISDRNKSTYGRILRTSTSNTEYIIGHVIWSGLLCVSQSLILVGIISICNINIGISLINFYIIMMLISIIAIALGIFTVSFCKNEEQVTLINALIVFPSCMLSGCLWPIEIMSDSLQKLSYIFPQRYVFIIMEQLKQYDHISIVFLNILLVLLISLLILVIGIINIERVSLKELS